jgi:hypothetical protein
MSPNGRRARYYRVTPSGWEWSEVSPSNWERVLDLSGFARLKPEVTLREARAQLHVISRQYAAAHPGLPDADPNAYCARSACEGSMREARHAGR